MIDVGIDPATGRRKQKKKGGFTTKSDAQDAAALVHVEVTEGTYVEEKSVTFEDFVPVWRAAYAGSGRVKESTLRVRDYEVERLMPFFAKLKMKNITREQYQDALNSLKAEGLADNTLDGIHRTGRMVFKRAVEYQVIRTDPTEYTYVPKTQKTVEELEIEEAEIKYLEKEELALFLETALTQGLEQDYAIFITLAYTGLRAGELCALKYRDIDFVNLTIKVSKTYYNPVNNRRKFKLLPPKTKKARRTIDVEPIVLSAIEDLRTVRDRERARVPDIYFDQDFVFAETGDDLPGYPTYIKKIENRMARLLQIAGLNTDLTPHSLRHTHVSLLAEAGVPLHEIMDRMGHKDDEVTKQVYLHVTKHKKKEASQKFAELLKDL